MIEDTPTKSSWNVTPHVSAENAPEIGVQIRVIILGRKSLYLKRNSCDLSTYNFFQISYTFFGKLLSLEVKK